VTLIQLGENAESRPNAMTVALAKRRVVAVVCGCVAVLLLGALIAVFECGRNLAPHSLWKVQLKPRKAEDAITPVAKDPDRHAQFLERSKQGDIDVVFLGDSITARWPRVGEWSWRKLAPYKPANFGVDGDCTEHLLWRLEHGELNAISPKVVVLLIGSNNVSYFADETPEWTARGVEKIVTVIQKRSPASKVLLLGIFPRDEKESRVRRTIGAVNREIQRLDDGARVRFVDIGDQFLDADGNIPAGIMPDQVHLSAKGYDLWYRSLESILPGMLK
jgi:lysophospholipase L1-like esterase